MAKSDDLIGCTVGSLYKVGKKFDQGSFGEVRYGKHLVTGRDVAIKFEHGDRDEDSKQLAMEFCYYRMLGQAEGVPKVYFFGPVNAYSALVMELLGPNLEQLLVKCNRKLSLKTVAMIAIQTIKRVRHLHKTHLINHDIKPDNFVIGRKESQNESIIYMVDLGLATQYVVNFEEKYVPHKKVVGSVTGTVRYVSLNTHYGEQASRRDDMESLCYVWLYLLRGNLPWQGLIAKDSDAHVRLVAKVKSQTSIEELCANHPPEFATVLRYCRGLKVHDEPNYQYMINLFESLLTRNGWRNDGIFDWTVKQELQFQKENNHCCLFFCAKMASWILGERS